VRRSPPFPSLCDRSILVAGSCAFAAPSADRCGGGGGTAGGSSPTDYLVRYPLATDLNSLSPAGFISGVSATLQLPLDAQIEIVAVLAPPPHAPPRVYHARALGKAPILTRHAPPAPPRPPPPYRPAVPK
jgi:hypothetical protein